MFILKNKWTLRIISLFCFACILIDNTAVSQINLINTKIPNVIRIGVRDAAYPIAHDLQAPRYVDGFCGTFGRLLREKTKKEIVYADIENEYLDDDGFHRFDGLRIGSKSTIYGVDIECGPNSKSIDKISVAEDIGFSNSFYSTGVKLLIEKSLAIKINQNPEELKKYAIGYVKKTTTLSLLKKINGLSLEPYGTRDKALNALESGEIQIYASDAIILRTLLKEKVTERHNTEGKLLRRARNPYGENYTLYPDRERRYINGDEKTENYVIAISAKTPYYITLKNVINETLSEGELNIQERKNLEDYENQKFLPTVQEDPWWQQVLLNLLKVLIIGLGLFIVWHGGIFVFRFLNNREKDRTTATIKRSDQETSSPSTSPPSIYVSTTTHLHNQQDMSKPKYDLREANVGGIIDTAEAGSHQNFTQNNNYTREQRQTISEAAREIQQLLKQLELSNPDATESQQINYVNDETSPGFKRRVVSALQAGSEKAIEEFLDNSYLNIGMAIVKGWSKPE